MSTWKQLNGNLISWVCSITHKLQDRRLFVVKISHKDWAMDTTLAGAQVRYFAPWGCKKSVIIQRVDILSLPHRRCPLSFAMWSYL